MRYAILSLLLSGCGDEHAGLDHWTTCHDSRALRAGVPVQGWPSQVILNSETMTWETDYWYIEECEVRLPDSILDSWAGYVEDICIRWEPSDTGWCGF